MKILISSIIFITINLTITKGANILVIRAITAESHKIWSTPYIETLASRGHNLTIIMPEAPKTTKANLHFLSVPDTIKGRHKYELEALTESSSFFWIRYALSHVSTECKTVLHSDAFKVLMNYPASTKFDAVITEMMGCECLFGAMAKFGNPPIIIISATTPASWTLQQIGTPNVPSHMPHLYAPSISKMDFGERFMNLLYHVYAYVYRNLVYLPQMNSIAKEYYEPPIPPVEDFSKDISLVLANFHPAFDFSWARTPNLIPVAGMHIKEPKLLQKDLQKFLDEAKNGAIFFSLGSRIRSDTLSKEKLDSILQAFRELRQRVVWKFESEIPGLPKNVRVSKWFPQNDILAHPNVKAFITHGGLLSVHEAIYREVPVVGIPFILDQHQNIRKIVHFGAGVRVGYNELTKNTFLSAIRSIINDPSYKENMKLLSWRFRDEPETPLERAVNWTEYVIRYKGAPHMRSSAVYLNMAQYLLLDVIAFVAGVLATAAYVVYYLLHRCRRFVREYTKLKKN